MNDVKDKIISIYEAALNDYADPSAWVRGVVYNRRSQGRLPLYGMDRAIKAKQEADELLLKEMEI